MTFKTREPFFVQETPRGVWHVETPDDPEKMLCGLTIPVNSNEAVIQRAWGLKPCLWCKRALDLSSLESSPSPSARLTSSRA